MHVIKPEVIARSKEKTVMQYVQLSRATLKVPDEVEPIVSAGAMDFVRLSTAFFERMHQRRFPGMLVQPNVEDFRP